MDPNIIFRDPKSDDDAVLRAASQLASLGVAARLWADVANDPSYRAFHRNVAIYELLKRHLVRRSTLDEAASLLAGGRWLLDAVIEKIEAMGGEIPVKVPAAGAAFIIRFPKDPAASHPDVGIYVALDRNLDAALLRGALMSQSDDARLGKTRIVDFALFPASLALASVRSGDRNWQR